MDELNTDILLLDIRGFSLMDNRCQYDTATLMTSCFREAVELVVPMGVWESGPLVLGVIPTGDGFYILLRPRRAGLGVAFALGLRNILLHRNAMAGSPFPGVRLSVHHGTIVPFRDAAGHVNFVGTGMNECARLNTLPHDLEAVAEGFSGDGNWVNVSTVAWEQARNRLDPGLTSRSGLRVGPVCRLLDKHQISHAFRFVELSRTWVAGGV